MNKKTTNFFNVCLVFFSLLLLIPLTLITGKYIMAEAYRQKVGNLIHLELLAFIPLLLIIAIFLFFINTMDKNKKLNAEKRIPRNLYFFAAMIVCFIMFLAIIYNNILLSFIGLLFVLFLYLIIIILSLKANHNWFNKSIFIAGLIIFTVFMFLYINADLSRYKLANYRDGNLILSHEFNDYNKFIYQNREYTIDEGKIYDEDGNVFAQLPGDYFGNAIFDENYLYFEVNKKTIFRLEFIETEGLPFILYMNKYGLIEYRRLNLDTKQIEEVSKEDFKTIERYYCDEYGLHMDS